MRKSLVTALALIYPFFSQANAGEITALQWTILGGLEVFYAVSEKQARQPLGQKVDCTAFNDSGKPIGGGFAFSEGLVARVTIEVPDKYKNTSKVSVRCFP